MKASRMSGIAAALVIATAMMSTSAPRIGLRSSSHGMDR